MPAPYSIDLRSRIIAAYAAKEGSQRQLAERFKVSLTFVRNLLRHYREMGELSPKRRGGGAKAKISAESLPIVQQLLDENNDALLKELTNLFSVRTGMAVSLATMHRALGRLGVTRKKKALYATEQETERVELLRRNYRDWSFSIDPKNLVFVDESGVNLGMTRLYGRALRGQRVVGNRPRNCGDNVTVIGALSMEGLIATMSVTGSTNTAVFQTYVNEVLVPQLWPGAIVVMDNLSVHKAADIREAIEGVGAKLVYLPPYSPDLSPIELCWSKVKQFLRSMAARTYEALDQALTNVIGYITEDDAKGWFAHCGLFI